MDRKTAPVRAAAEAAAAAAAKKTSDDDGGGDDADDGAPASSSAQAQGIISPTTGTDTGRKEQLWFLEEERWELTWPIWHMLSRSERKELASKHGYKTIGEFEEYMTLQRAVGDSAAPSKPYDHNLAYYPATNASSPDESTLQQTHDDDDDRKPKAREDDDGDDDDDDDNSTDEKLEDDMESERVAATDKLPTEELLRVGGLILLLPEEMLHRIFDWLPVDAYATLALVSPHWASFTRTETAYKRLCERLYLNQSMRRALHVSRFGNSYRTMLETRPRVRAGGGAYVMRYAQVKPIQRDMWTEIPKGAILETVYYRYLYFQENGRVLYALTSSPPQEMFHRFLRVCLTREEDNVAVWGTYQVQKRHVVVTARQAWQHVKLELTIQPSTLHGRFGLLSFDSHASNTSGDFDSHCPNKTQYEVPEVPFRFVKDKRL